MDKKISFLSPYVGQVLMAMADVIWDGIVYREGLFSLVDTSGYHIRALSILGLVVDRECRAFQFT
jgi:hypothetical protein